ncbi:MAG: ABC transporter ATP-binding protein [Myxococcales bacterium]|nr:ABC transporter ATP-binding protein [Myxococcales bacterium]
MIRCEGLVQRFGGRTVLHGVSLDVPRGSVFGFIGPNGAGKTTTIRILATLSLPTEGRAEVAGVDVIAHPAEVRRKLGYMPDNAGIYERITAQEYLEFFASAAGVAVASRAKVIANVVELTEIGHLAGREVMALSKGQRQRLLLARTLLHDPEVLILDEPASDLDPRARIELRLLFAELGRMGKTIFLSSHILTELADICSHVGIIEQGRIVTAGTMADLQARLRPGLRVKLSALGPFEALDRVLKTFSFVKAVTPVATEAHEPREVTRVAVHYEGDHHRLAELVAALCRAEIALIAVEPERTNLEQIFMDVTTGAQPTEP